MGPIRSAQGGALGDSLPRAETPSPEPDPDAGNRRTRRTVLDEPPRQRFRGQPHDAAPETCAPKGAVPDRPPSPAGDDGLAVADPSPASGSGFLLAGVFLREARKSPVGTARFRRARRPFPGRKDVSAAGTGWPSGQFGTPMLLTSPTLSRSTRITGLHLNCKTKCSKETKYMCISHDVPDNSFTSCPQVYSQDAMLTCGHNRSLFGTRSRRLFAVFARARRRRTVRVVSGRNGSRVVDPVHSS